MTDVRFSTALGDFNVALDDAAAPTTVANFLRYVEAAAYDGAAFTRVVTPETSANDLLPDASGIEASELPNGDVPISVVQGDARNEFPRFAPINLETTHVTGLRHLEGTISMGRLGRDSATTEFFICLEDQPALDCGGTRNPDGYGFAAFGQVTRGLEVIRKIQQAPAEGQTLTPPVRIVDVCVL